MNRSAQMPSNALVADETTRLATPMLSGLTRAALESGRLQTALQATRRHARLLVAGGFLWGLVAVEAVKFISVLR